MTMLDRGFRFLRQSLACQSRLVTSIGLKSTHFQSHGQYIRQLSAHVQKKEKEKDESNAISRNEDEYNEMEYHENEHENEKTDKKLKPQEELLESWYITLDDRVESLTNHIRGLKKKRLHIIGALSAFTMGSMAWYQMGLFELPYELKAVMVHVPMGFLFCHWFYFWYKSDSIYKELKFEKVIDEPYYSDDIRYESPKRKKRLPIILQLIDVKNEQSMDAVDKFCKLVPTTKRFAQATCALSMCSVAALLTINPLADSMLTNLETYQFYAYSCYPIIPYSFTLIMHWAHFENIPLLTQLVKEELADEEAENENDNDNNDNDYDNVDTKYQRIV